MSQSLAFPGPGSDQFCWMCKASVKGVNDFKNFDDNAPHRDTRQGHAEYVEACAAKAVRPSYLLTSCPGVGLEHICIDSMHCADLGTFQECAMSGKFELCSTLTARSRHVWQVRIFSKPQVRLARHLLEDAVGSLFVAEVQFRGTIKTGSHSN